jgi:hypothetical protein
MMTFSSIFDAFGGPAALGRALGITTEHAVQMRRRNSIPPEHWPALVEIAQREGMQGITTEALLSARTAKKPDPTKTNPTEGRAA